MQESEEHHEWSKLRSWFLIIGLSGSLYLVMSVLMMIEEKPRQWDFDTIPFTPSQSVYSSNVPDLVPREKMVEPLPNGVSMKEKGKKQK